MQRIFFAMSVLSVGILSFLEVGCKARNDSYVRDLATNVNLSNFGMILDHLYYIEEENGIPIVVRGVCSGNSTGIDGPTTTDCQEGTDTNRVPLSALLDTYKPGLFDIIQKFSHADANLKIRDVSARRLADLPQAEREPALQFIREGRPTAAENQSGGLNYLNRIAAENYGILNIVAMMANRGDAPIIIRTDDLSAIDRRLVAALRVLPDNFAAAQSKRGLPCARPSERYSTSTEAGGCLDTESGLVWSASKLSSDGLSAEFWQSYPFATRYCRQSGFGGKHDWRIPTLEELKTLKGEGETSVNVFDTRYYWTQTTGYLTNTDVRVQDLPSVFLDASSETVLVGYNESEASSSSARSSSDRFSYYLASPFTGPQRSTSGESSSRESGSSSSSSAPVYGTRTSALNAINRVVRGEFRYREDFHSLYRLDQDEVFYLKEHSLESATGALSQDTERTTTEPVVGTETSRYEGYYSASHGFSDSYSGPKLGTVNGGSVTFGHLDTRGSSL